MEYKDEQKRSDFRSGSVYPIWYRDLEDYGRERDWARTSTRDLSGGGASFALVDPKRLERRSGDVLEVQVIVPPAPVFAIAQIVRVFQDEEKRLCAAVMFVSIESNDRDRIVRVALNEGLDRP